MQWFKWGWFNNLLYRQREMFARALLFYCLTFCWAMCKTHLTVSQLLSNHCYWYRHTVGMGEAHHCMIMSAVPHLLVHGGNLCLPWKKQMNKWQSKGFSLIRDVIRDPLICSVGIKVSLSGLRAVHSPWLWLIWRETVQSRVQRWKKCNKQMYFCGASRQVSKKMFHMILLNNGIICLH